MGLPPTRRVLEVALKLTVVGIAFTKIEQAILWDKQGETPDMEPCNKNCFLVAERGELGPPRLFAIVDLQRRRVVLNLLSFSHFLVTHAGFLVSVDRCLQQLAVDSCVVFNNPSTRAVGTLVADSSNFCVLRSKNLGYVFVRVLTITEGEKEAERT